MKSAMMINRPAVIVEGAQVVDWESMTEAGAFCLLCKRLDVVLRVDPDGTLKATGNTKAAQPYIADIAARYRGEIIAHLLGLPAPSIETPEEVQREGEGFIQMAQALDVVMTEYCTAAGHEQAYLDRLLQVRRRMAPYLLVQNLCAFRSWLFGLQRYVEK